MTLTESAYWTKRLGIVAGVAILLIFIVLLVIFYAPKDEAPSEYLTANYACTDTGEEFLENTLKLNSLELGSESEMIFQIETTNGQISSLPSIINVYAFEEQGQSINSQLEATTIANKLGFDEDVITRPDTRTYQWIDSTRKRTLTIDAATLNFTMTSDPDFVREISEKSTLPTKSEAISIAINALKQANLMDDDYISDTAIQKIYYIDINPDGSYSEAESSGEADLIRVDLYRRKSVISILETVENAEEMRASLQEKIIGDDSVLTEEEETVVKGDNKVVMHTFSTFVLNENPYKTNISVYIGPENKDAENTKEIYGIEYTNWPIQEYPCGTYKLIAPSEAIQEIQDGNGYLMSLILKNGDHVEPYQTMNVQKFIVYDIYIAYYEPSEYIPFLQPIYVVEGEAILDSDEKAEFVYYVPAINYNLVTDPVIEETTTDGESTEEVLEDF